MRRRPVTITAACIFTAAMLAGCGDDNGELEVGVDTGEGDIAGESPGDDPQTTGPGVYEFESMGARGEIVLPAEPVAHIEELREAVGTDPVAYVTAEVDNRDGEERVNMYRINVYTPEGEELEYVGASEYVGELIEEVSTSVPSQFNEVYNKHLDDASPGEVKEFVLVGPEVPEEIASLQVYPHGGFVTVDAVAVE